MQKQFSVNLNKKFDYFLSYEILNNNIGIHTDNETIINDLNHFFHYKSSKNYSKTVWNIYLHGASQLAEIDHNQSFKPIELELGDTGDIFEDNAITIIKPKSTNGIIYVHHELKDIHVCNPVPRMLFNDTYRVVRQILNQQLLSHSIPIHGSALRIKDKTIAFLGDSGRGKSTYVTGMLYYNPDTSYIANDKFYLSDADYPKIAQWAECPAISYNTLNLFSNLPKRMDALHAMKSEFDPSHIFLDHPPLPTYNEIMNKKSTEKVIFTNAQYARLMSREILHESDLDVIVWLEMDIGAEPQLIQVPESDYQELLAENTRTVHSFPDWINIRNNKKSLSDFKQFPTIYSFVRSNNLEFDVRFIVNKLT
ncbi:hypothetical protein D3P07_05390 [Paenibacillus sp. 1011MAR3C5]|uniref:hypothetical protein n=1 Tax=Paenibacillus sp. 1011MAR3C5 TaxID=1675787 RepID=UPI000E6BCAD9|nr:hypothetical protein [Paenibacillus sp. 1011MAR3C5]RJE89673.1 hypothetical protein D3P07_05390 [Paenibacillus sp. 1011MAR3C5]